MKNLAKLTACVLSVFMLMSSAVFAAGDVSRLNIRAYMANKEQTAVGLRSSVKGVEVEVKNEAEQNRNFSLIVIKYSGEICKEVLISDTVNVPALGEKSEKISVETGSISGIDSLKCIVVESNEDGLFPVINEVSVLKKAGWSAE